MALILRLLVRNRGVKIKVVPAIIVVAAALPNSSKAAVIVSTRVLATIHLLLLTLGTPIAPRLATATRIPAAIVYTAANHIIIA